LVGPHEDWDSRLKNIATRLFLSIVLVVVGVDWNFGGGGGGGGSVIILLLLVVVVFS